MLPSHIPADARHTETNDRLCHRHGDYHPAVKMRTVRVVDGQDVSVIADARHPWNGRFTVEGRDAVLLLRLLIIHGQRNVMGGAVWNRGGQVRYACIYVG